MAEKMVPIFAGIGLAFAKVFGVPGFLPHHGIGRVLYHARHVVDAFVTEFLEGDFHGWREEVAISF